MAQQIHIDIEIDGQRISPFSHLTLHQQMDWHHHFELVLPVDAFQGTYQTALNHARNYMGCEIIVKFRPHIFVTNKQDSLFKGLVTEVGVSRRAQGHREIVLRGQSPTILMDGVDHCRSFTEKKLKDIAEEALEKIPSNQLSVQIKPSFTEQIPYFVQYKESNYHLLLRLAALYGEWCFYDGTKLIMGSLPKDKTVDLPVNKDLHDLDFSLKLIPVNFSMLAYNYEENVKYTTAAAQTSVSDLDLHGKFALKKSEEFYKQEALHATVHPVGKEEELKSWVARRKEMACREMVVATGTSDNPFLNVGSIINITGEGMNEEDYGRFIVTTLIHSTDGLGNYQNRFEAIPEEASAPPYNARVTYPVPEIQTAVVKDNKDPKGLGRIKVAFQWQKSPETSPWIRLANTSSGKSGQVVHGFFFIPEIGDEVLVGFEDDNPARPFVMGSVYHGKTSEPAWQDQNNKNKVIRTRSGNQIHLIDEDGKEEIRIINKEATSPTNMISLSMEGNGKITIETKGDLSISAKTITMNAQETISMSSGKSTHLKAKEIAMNAETSCTLTSKDMGFESSSTILNATKKLDITGGESKLNATTLEIDGGTQASVKAAVIQLNC